MPNRNIVVLGASAGGLDPLRTILSALPEEVPAALFVVQHLAADAPGQLVRILSGSCPARVKWAENGEPIRHGVVHVAPPNRHLLLEEDQARVLFGPRECGARPSVDVLFRSAAVTFGSRVVGVILSGKLDDGSHGLRAVQRCGGLAVVMSPDSAEEPDMPRNALRNVKADHVLAPAAIGLLLRGVIGEEVASEPALPKDIKLEDRVARNAMTASFGPPPGGRPTLSCPECGGELSSSMDGEDAHYRC